MNSSCAAAGPASTSQRAVRHARTRLKGWAAVFACGWLCVPISSAADSPGEARALFNGRDLSGWQVWCKPADKDKNFWRVEDGCIVVDSLDDPNHNYVWLATEGEYSDFELRLKFQAFRNSPGNSGVQFRSRYDASAGWLDGPQIDIHPPGSFRTGMIYDETRGVQKWVAPDLKKVGDARPEMATNGLTLYFSDEPPGWNDLEITARGTHVRVALNGLVVRDWNGAGVLDDAIHRLRQTGMSGHLALQLHTGDRLKMRFKDIRLREIPPAPENPTPEPQ